MTARWQLGAAATILLTVAAVPGGGIAQERSGPVDAATARRAAGEILRQDRYQPRRRPPGQGVLARVGGWVRDLFDRLFGELAANTFGRVAAVALAVLLAAGLALVVARRRGAGAVATRRRPALFAEDDDPDDLERRARAAAAAGDHSLALRLWFRAGLVRLHRSGRVRIGPSMTTREIARAVGSARFDELGRTFDRVAYGGVAAGPDDVAAAVRTWPAVVEEAGARR